MTTWSTTDILDHLTRVLVVVERDAFDAAGDPERDSGWKDRAADLVCDAMYARALIQDHTSFEVLSPVDLTDRIEDLPRLYDALATHLTGDSSSEAMKTCSAIGAVLEEVRHLGLLADAA